MSAPPTRPVSLWDKTAPPAPETPPLEGDHSCDVAVVGAGFTGLSAAITLAGGGASVRVLEAVQIGYGGSGRNAGLVNPGMWYHPGEVVDVLGEEAGERLNRAFASGPAAVYDLIERHGIECELTRTGTIYLAIDDKAARKLEARAEAMNARGARVEVLDRDGTAGKTGTDRYAAGLLDPDAGTINPMGYVRGLARAALEAGATIHAGSPVTAIERAGDAWRLRTAGGTVTAPQVILATNAYTDKLWPGLQQEIIPFYFCHFATKPLSENVRRTILPERQGAWDSRTAMNMFRFDAAGRLIIGTVGSINEDARSFRNRWAERTLAGLFPHLGEVEWDYQWLGQIAFTVDHVPRLHKPEPGVIACLGYNGRGIGPGTVTGRAIANHLLSDGREELPIPVTEPKPASFRNLRAAYYDIGAGILQIGQMMR